MPLKDFNETFAAELQDVDFAAAYLEAALKEEGAAAFLAALQNVARANGEMLELGQTTSLGRESLSQALSEQGSLEFKTLNSLLRSVGMRFAILPGESVLAQRKAQA